MAKTFPSKEQEEKEQKQEEQEDIYQAPEKIKHSSSSIIGLRGAVAPSSSKTNLQEQEESGSRSRKQEQEETLSKPRPPPKPRPWSLVGTDRKSGDFDGVEGKGGSPPHVEEDEEQEEEEEEGKEGRRGSLVTNQRGSVRDMIASLNRPEKEGVGTVGGLLGASSVRDRIASMNKGDERPRAASKGNSLPRTGQDSGLAKAGGQAGTKGSPGITSKMPGSPKAFRKESDTASDPRILKLDDEFMYEDSGSV